MGDMKAYYTSIYNEGMIGEVLRHNTAEEAENILIKSGIGSQKENRKDLSQERRTASRRLKSKQQKNSLNR